MKTKKRLTLIILVIFLALTIHSKTLAEGPYSEPSQTVQLVQDNSQKGMTQEPLDPYLERFNSYLRNREYEKAIEEAKTMIKIAPNDSRGYRALKGTYVRMGRYEEALKVSSERTNDLRREEGAKGPICRYIESHFRILQRAKRGEEAVEYLKAHREECPKTVKYLTTVLEKGKSEVERSDKVNVDGYNRFGTNLFWFVVITDTHIGWPHDDASDNLIGLVGNVNNTIRPRFIIHTGDLTDQIWEGEMTGGSENKKAQWAKYRSILNYLNMQETDDGVPKYTEVPGNHDQYFESKNSALANYKKYSIAGQATKETHRSWVLKGTPNEYHFVSLATTDPDKTDPIIDGLYDSPGLLSETELDFLETELKDHSGVNHTFVFGHHVLKLNNWGVIREGRDRLMRLLCDDENKRNHTVSMYGHGHTHLDELIDPYYERCKDPRHKVLVYNFPTLWADRKYSVVAVDNNGISIKSAELYNWPVVLITAPINKNLNGGNPNSHPIPRQEKNPIRALVFSKREIRKVDYIIDNDISTPRSMKQVADSSPYYPYLWEAEWDTRSLSPGPHTIRVRADEIPIESSRDQIRVDIE